MEADAQVTPDDHDEEDCDRHCEFCHIVEDGGGYCCHHNNSNANETTTNGTGTGTIVCTILESLT